MAIQHFEINLCGKSHIEKGTKCQDCCGYAETTLGQNGPRAVVTAVADGVGSASRSDEGSHIAVAVSLEYIEKKLADQSDPTDDAILNILRNAFEAACDAIDEDSREKCSVIEMATTLTLAVYVEDGTVYIGHIGDSGIVAMFADGEYKMVTTRHKGEAANSVYTLYEHGSDERWQFKRLEKPVASLALMTDGVLDTCVDREKLGSRVYFPFIGRALTMPCDGEQRIEQELEFWKSMLCSEEWRKRITDDITLCVVQNPEQVKALPEIRFDEEAWKRQSQQVREQEERQLRAGSEEYLANWKSAKNSGAHPQKQSKPPQPGEQSANKPASQNQPAKSAKKPASQNKPAKPGTQSVHRNKPANGAKKPAHPNAPQPNPPVVEEKPVEIHAEQNPAEPSQRVPWIMQPIVIAFGLMVAFVFTDGLCWLFPGGVEYMRVQSFVCACFLSLSMTYAVFRSLYTPHRKEAEAKKWFCRAAGISVLAQIASAVFVHMIIYSAWPLLAFLAALLFAAALIVMGL